MKSAYELAMERLNKSAPPATKVTEAQRKKLADLDSEYAAKIAEREVLLNDEMMKARAKGDMDAMDQLQKQLLSDRKSLQVKLEEKKEAVRRQAGS